MPCHVPCHVMLCYVVSRDVKRCVTWYINGIFRKVLSSWISSAKANPRVSQRRHWLLKLNICWDGYGSIPINTIFSGMNIHLPAILMFTRGTRFWPTAICWDAWWKPSEPAMKVVRLTSLASISTKGWRRTTSVTSWFLNSMHLCSLMIMMIMMMIMMIMMMIMMIMIIIMMADGYRSRSTEAKPGTNGFQNQSHATRHGSTLTQTDTDCNVRVSRAALFRGKGGRGRGWKGTRSYSTSTCCCACADASMKWSWKSFHEREWKTGNDGVSPSNAIHTQTSIYIYIYIL